MSSSVLIQLYYSKPVVPTWNWAGFSRYRRAGGVHRANIRRNMGSPAACDRASPCRRQQMRLLVGPAGPALSLMMGSKAPLNRRRFTTAAVEPLGD